LSKNYWTIYLRISRPDSGVSSPRPLHSSYQWCTCSTWPALPS